MAGSFSGHMINKYHARESTSSQIVTSGAMSFNPMMHGTPMPTTPFTFFGSQAGEDSAAKVALLQAKLNQRLGPEYISQRPGPGGGPKLTYAEGWKIINLANEVFGFNGWSSSIVSLTVDFIDCNEESKRYNVGVTAVVRVTLRDGVSHEDIGYGILENSKSKGQALDKCKKEAVTDGLKRALRNFGNVLGNCLYDKSYTQEVVKMKVAPAKFNKSELHRRPEFEETKPNISNIETTPITTPAPVVGPSTSGEVNRSTNIASMRPPQHVPPKQPASIPPHMLAEVQRATSSSINSPSVGSNSRSSSLSRHERIKAQLDAQDQRDLSHGDISTSTVDTSLNDISFVKREREDHEDSFGYSEDDAFLAAVDLEHQIEEDADTGRPIDYEEIPVRDSDNTSSSASSRHSGDKQVTTRDRSTTRQPPPQRLPRQQPAHATSNSNPPTHPHRLEQNLVQLQDQNMVPLNSVNNVSTTKKTSASAGAFHFPPGMNLMQPTSNRQTLKPGSHSNPTIGAKRPAEAMAKLQGTSSHSELGVQRGGPAGGSRQILGDLGLGEGGDMKRLRRQ